MARDDLQAVDAMALAVLGHCGRIHDSILGDDVQTAAAEQRGKDRRIAKVGGVA